MREPIPRTAILAILVAGVLAVYGPITGVRLLKQRSVPTVSEGAGSRPSPALFGAPAGTFRPIYSLYARSVAVGYRFTSLPFTIAALLFHALCVIALASLVRTVSRSSVASLAAGLVFAMHPLGAQSLCLASMQVVIPATLLCLLTARTFGLFQDLPSGGSAAYFGPGGISSSLRAMGAPWLSALLFLLACLTLEWSLLLPVALILFPLPAASQKSRMRRLLPLCLVGFGVIVVSFYRHARLLPSAIDVARAGSRFLRGLGLLVYPFTPPLAATGDEPMGLSRLLLPLLAIVVLVLIARRERGLSGTLVWLLVMGLPASLEPRFQEGQLYLALAGLAWLAGLAVSAVFAKLSSRLRVAFGVLLVAALWLLALQSAYRYTFFLADSLTVTLPPLIQ